MNLLNSSREDIQGTMLSQLYELYRAGNRSILIQGPTGIGKTYLACRVASGTVKRGGNVLFVAPRRRLVKQLHATACIFGLEPSFMMADSPYNRSAKVQVACDATLKIRIKRAERLNASNDLMTFLKTCDIKDSMPRADTVIVDECHIGDIHWLKEIYPDAVFVGLSATPIQANGDGLGDQYQDMVLGPQVQTLVSAGLLLPAKVINAEGLVLPTGMCKRKRPQLLGEVVDQWTRHAWAKRTVVFAKSVAHSKHLCEQFNARGIPAEHVDSSVSDEPGEDGVSERDKIYARLASGKTKVICNFGILVEGIDIPAIECIVLARPSKSQVMGLITYLQAVGRGRRPYPGQEHLTVIDFTRTAEVLGKPDRDWEWSLDVTERETREAIARKKKEGEDILKDAALVLCLCGAEYDPAPKCPQCGRPTPERKEVVEEIPVELVEAGSGKKAKMSWSREKVEQFYREAMGYYRDHRKSEKWLASAMAFANERIPPPHHLPFQDIRALVPCEPSVETIRLAHNSRKQYFLLKNKGIIKGKKAA